MEKKMPAELFGTVFDVTRRWRYTLERQLQPKLGSQGGLCVFVCCNPSTADEHTDDPTVRRCQAYAQLWGYSTLQVLNIFAWRATDPSELYACADPVGRDNDMWIGRVAEAADLVVCAWGVQGHLNDRGPAVLALLRGLDVAPQALRMTADGSPGHPLYLPANLKPKPIKQKEEE